jgi:hypothetical protein
VTIDLSTADLANFDAYESTVLALLPLHGARLEARVRTIDGAGETHLLFFPDDESYEAYLANPVRLAARAQWEKSGATAVSQEVVRL